VFNTSALNNTLKQVLKRVDAEGIGFLTKTLPRLGKAFDKAISGTAPLDSTQLYFSVEKGSKLPRFLGEFFKRVLSADGMLLEHPCAVSVGVIRDICYLFYKYELPYSDDQEQEVIAKFERTEQDLVLVEAALQEIGSASYNTNHRGGKIPYKDYPPHMVVRDARRLLQGLFSTFDPKDIYPKHGPGAVSTRERLQEKYLWKNVSAKITDVYPFDEYFCSSLGHVCDTFDSFKTITDTVNSARVILVPKDSRGPRLISCEPVDYQWIQQGLGGAIVDLVESHPLTRDNVRFTDQSPNRFAALMGSKTGRYATLDLNEASDRVSTALVRLLFPDTVLPYLEACRTSSTVLPDGRVLELRKFAPMGSCLCFPILALTVWAILAAGVDDTDTRESIYVYGDDVIVPTHYAPYAIKRLEAVGLRVNRDKSCTGGLFRESCGMDAFQGVTVTPVRLRTVWSSSPSPEVYTSWISYANSFYDRQYYGTYDYVVQNLLYVYKEIPDAGLARMQVPALTVVPEHGLPKRARTNKRLQKREVYVWSVQSPVIKRDMPGWSMLLRYFAECGNARNRITRNRRAEHGELTPPRYTLEHEQVLQNIDSEEPFSVRQYTRRSTSMLVKRWL